MTLAVKFRAEFLFVLVEGERRTCSLKGKKVRLIIRLVNHRQPEIGEVQAGFARKPLHRKNFLHIPGLATFGNRENLNRIPIGSRVQQRERRRVQRPRKHDQLGSSDVASPADLDIRDHRAANRAAKLGRTVGHPLRSTVPRSRLISWAMRCACSSPQSLGGTFSQFGFSCGMSSGTTDAKYSLGATYCVYRSATYAESQRR